MPGTGIRCGIARGPNPEGAGCDATGFRAP